MTRYIVLGNGNLTILYDKYYTIRELYYPLTTTNNCEAIRIGFMVDGKFSWIHNLNPYVNYCDEALCSIAKLKFNNINLEILDTVDMAYDVLVRRIKVDGDKEVKLCLGFSLNINNIPDGDTALYDPNSDSIIHYKGSKWFLISSDIPFDSYATGQKGFKGFEGTWRDCEDGRLSGNKIAQGSVDSAILFEVQPPAEFHVWLIAENSYANALRKDSYVRNKNPQKLIKRTIDYWKAWLNRANLIDYAFEKELRRSLLILATHSQNNGAIIASLDTDILRFNRDTYNYVWHRDSSFVAIAYDMMGYIDKSRNLFQFSRKLNTLNGALFQKYTVEGHWGSTWHPWDENTLPIQEDETALLLYALWYHFSKWKDVDFVKELYRPLIKGLADFLVRYRDSSTDLPLPSYDLWEERKGVHFFTTVSVIAGLEAAAKFAEFFGEDDIANNYRKVSLKIRGKLDLFWSKDHYARSLILKDGKIEKDEAVDASTVLATLLGVIDIRDPKVETNVNTVEEKLRVKGEGIARYEGDGYMKEGDKPNAWFITTLWLSQYYAISGDTERAKKKLKWVLDNSLPTGVIPEQISENGNYPSVSPLSWSHAETIRAIYAIKNGKLE
ncbi:MAG: glycoside hydrolase family 15 protein [Sulfolobaceae archaeon]